MRSKIDLTLIPALHRPENKSEFTYSETSKGNDELIVERLIIGENEPFRQRIINPRLTDSKLKVILCNFEDADKLIKEIDALDEEGVNDRTYFDRFEAYVAYRKQLDEHIKKPWTLGLFGSGYQWTHGEQKMVPSRGIYTQIRS